MNIEDLLEQVPSPMDYNIAALGSSCAIVGNSGNVLEHEYGELIDSHDVVIRFNYAPTIGYEKHVGKKTTCRLSNSHLFHAAIENTTFDLEHMRQIFSKFDKNAIYDVENELIIIKYGVEPSSVHEVIKKVEEKNNKVVFMNLNFYIFCNQIINAHSTNGFVAIIMALKCFQKISCFGFSFYEDDWSLRHYFENQIPHDQSCHNFRNEKKFVVALNNTGKIDIYPSVRETG